jgi:hypothetical protein
MASAVAKDTTAAAARNALTYLMVVLLFTALAASRDEDLNASRTTVGKSALCPYHVPLSPTLSETLSPALGPS